MDFIKKIFFYPRMAARYLADMFLRLFYGLFVISSKFLLIILGIVISLALLSYNILDKSLNTASENPPSNIIGLPGSYISDLLIQLFGTSSLFLAISLIIWGIYLLIRKSKPFWSTLFIFIVSFSILTLSFQIIYEEGGLLGHFIFYKIEPFFEFLFGANQEMGETSFTPQGIIYFFICISALALSNYALVPAQSKRLAKKKLNTEVSQEIKSNFVDVKDETFVEKKDKPIISRPKKAKPQISKRKPLDFQPTSQINKSGYEFPTLNLLKELPEIEKTELSDEKIEENRRLLLTVLSDYAVEGEIVNVRPGPIVTLYELKPAPGIRTKRVIDLADDIARSMSAISVRVAVVPGKNSIGIELPNDDRDTVFLREILESEKFVSSSQEIPLSLGKDIGGAPIIADLSAMPHLLISGTTGSGKSVGINGMILSILYKFRPDECRLIMVDPKMLELSVYDGIPHLLTPVVTDPKKAVVALKWVVREMEERYRKMSKISVRTMEAYNKKAEQYLKEGRSFKRRVHTGYDPENGEAMYEEEQITPERLPFIVVVIDEMADLMMVARNDIEHLIQRLAQMARAAGIHVVLATQRPSVDIVTGTIKANLPTRISFRVASKIDSRTILNEMGAEQLLGKGDMLFLTEGGIVTRVHGPFISDSEVERVVTHIRRQENPDYIESVIEEDTDLPLGDHIAEEGGDMLFNQAVSIIIRDQRASTSYIQRKLQIGYNRAARIIEEMEDKGIVSSPNNQGKREILKGND
ncbi:MAG: cell division protein FtsK [Rhodobiaceae bacterium]|nr:cell division protein FtsK [Rhodobiaceae bacterium]